jgi:hypothetical protein
MLVPAPPLYDMGERRVQRAWGYRLVGTEAH